MSQHAARLLAAELAKRTAVRTELIDIADLPLPTDDAGEATKDPEFSSKVNRADALVIISLEYWMAKTLRHGREHISLE